MTSYAQGSTDVPQPGPSGSSYSSDEPPRTAKIVLIGGASVGKTSLRNRYFRGPSGFSQAYIATIGADFTTKTIEVPGTSDAGGNDRQHTRISLQLWDTAGQERFQALGAAFYRGADACIIVYACNSRTSAERIESWYNAFIERCPLKDGQERTFPFICVGNKHDLVDSTSRQDLVEEEDVLDMLRRICPPVQPDKPVKKDAHPSGVPIVSDTNGVIQQQERELRGTPPTASASRQRRGSSTSTKRRSLEILPDLPRPNSRGPSVYHTPSSSLVHSSWATAKTSSSIASTTPPASSAGTFTTVRGNNGSSDILPAGSSEGRTDEGFENGYTGPVPAILEHHDEDEGIDDGATDDVLPAKEIFGVKDGIKHFYTSAKTGENVDEIFTYLAKRINARWKWQEEEDHLNGFLSLDGEPGNVRTGGKNDSIRVGGKGAGASGEKKGWRRNCC
ncbi:hypothetical protein P389DRAFT_192529 [Cystobasidium minutum MCA 4210]|uniref:uncharacterized protein n=1 Tax=Cystobasidium minutum MCA 4210 TaxID=1397322 RepID=UPI0034CFAD0D|eukprot:jgi/Rhomi1/192529/gm1.743_g